MKQYKYIGAPEGSLLNLSSTVTLKVKKSDKSMFIVENIIPNETIIDVDDPLVIKKMDLDSKYQEV